MALRHNLEMKVVTLCGSHSPFLKRKTFWDQWAASPRSLGFSSPLTGIDPCSPWWMGLPCPFCPRSFSFLPWQWLSYIVWTLTLSQMLSVCCCLTCYVFSISVSFPGTPFPLWPRTYKLALMFFPLGCLQWRSTHFLSPSKGDPMLESVGSPLYKQLICV